MDNMFPFNYKSIESIALQGGTTKTITGKGIYFKYGTYFCNLIIDGKTSSNGAEIAIFKESLVMDFSTAGSGYYSSAVIYLF